MNATIAGLYAALDEPDANVPLILSQLADAYEDAGDSVRARVIRWCWRRGKEPSRSLDLWDWWTRGWRHWPDSVPRKVYLLGDVIVGHRTRSAAYAALADACYEWVERRRGTV